MFNPAACRLIARCPLSPVARRFGLLAFLFFFVKGLLWLVVPMVAGWWFAR